MLNKVGNVDTVMLYMANTHVDGALDGGPGSIPGTTRKKK
jgi:hypothetical protein